MTHLRTDRLKEAHPLHQERIYELLRRAPFRLLIVHVYRKPEDQLALWRKGRTFNAALGQWEETGAIVTRAAPGTSPHEVVTAVGVAAALATDVVPLKDDGVAWWDCPNAMWQELYLIAGKFCGLDALGDPHGRFLAWDKGHFEEGIYQLMLRPLGLRMPDVSKLSVPV